jgi:hypothetical protein
MVPATTGGRRERQRIRTIGQWNAERLGSGSALGKVAGKFGGPRPVPHPRAVHRGQADAVKGELRCCSCSARGAVVGGWGLGRGGAATGREGGGD